MHRWTEQAGVAGKDGEGKDDEDGAGQGAEFRPAQELGEARRRPQPVVYGNRHFGRFPGGQASACPLLVERRHLCPPSRPRDEGGAGRWSQTGAAWVLRLADAHLGELEHLHAVALHDEGRTGEDVELGRVPYIAFMVKKTTGR